MTGIYKITNPEGKVYIGQSTKIKSRQNAYKRLACKTQKKIYNSILKYGWENHIFEVIEECSKTILTERERYWMELFSCVEKGLNLRYPSTKIKSCIISEETRDKLSKANTGKKVSEETREKIKKTLTGRKRCPEATKKAANKIKGRPRSEETKEKIRRALKGRRHSEERKAAISKAMKKVARLKKNS